MELIIASLAMNNISGGGERQRKKLPIRAAACRTEPEKPRTFPLFAENK
jgi:hypothetical protein